MAILNNTKITARLDYFAQTGPGCISLLVHRTMQHIVPTSAAKSLLDNGASVHIASALFCQENGILVYATNTLLATSTLNGQSVFGVTEPLTIRFGTAPHCVEMVIVALVVEGCDKLYQLLISNESAHRFQGIVNYGTNTVILHKADGEPVMLPLRQRP